MMNGTEDTRNQMTDFWKDHSKDGSLEEMMLDTQASVISMDEQPEILSLLPSIKGKKVLELGAGIGRFTGVLAEQAKHVTAVDFMETFVAKNRQSNGHKHNIDFLQADVTKLTLELDSYDVIFSNWLMMYLTDDETQTLTANVLSWLKPNGFMFFRESCFHQAGIASDTWSSNRARPSSARLQVSKTGNKKRNFNPTIYRNPSYYNSIFQGITAKIDDGQGTGTEGFELIFSRSIQSYIKLKNNQNQFCWLMQKVRLNREVNHGFATFQQFLDGYQYTRKGILRYERIFGDGYVSTGGQQTTQEFVSQLSLKPGQRVLDVGAGIGGGDFYMAQTYGVEVVGMDLSSNMIEVAMERATKHVNLKVQFEIADVTKREYEPESFDVVYSRDTILHIQDKLDLFRKFLTWLKPGGKLLISDYCCGDLPHTDAFIAYTALRGYKLYTPAQYGKLLEEAGFINVRAEDRTAQFMNVLTMEKTRMEDNKEDFIQEFSESDFQSLSDGWRDKLVRSKAGDQKWGLFYAEKSCST